MPKLRIEFTLVGAGRGRLGGQVEARSGEPLGAATLEVGPTPTATGDRPVVPTGVGTVFAVLAALGGAAYVDIGQAPDPELEPRLLVVPGRPQIVHVTPGQAIAAVLAAGLSGGPEILRVGPVDRSGSVTVGGAAQQACAANPDRRLLVVANPDETRAFWFNCAGLASTGSGSLQVGPGGAVVFDRVVPSGAVSILGPFQGQPFTVQEA